MYDQDFEELAKQCPDLIQKSEIEGMEIGAGWHHIIRTLCGLISYDVNQARGQVKYYTDEKDQDRAEQAQQRLNTALEELPVLTQIKEKFGSLRFYMDGGTVEQHNYVQFAESLTSHVCEICGGPGKKRHDGWIKVLCDAHHKPDDADLSDPLDNSKKSPRLSDETE